MRTFDFHKNQPEPVCRHCGLERDDHRKVQVLAESVYGDWGSDFYCPGSSTEFEAAEVQSLDSDDEDEPDCECVQIDVDVDDARNCPVHGPNSPLAKRNHQQEAEAEAKAAERMGILMGFDRED